MIGRRLAFDFGMARIGVAVCDREGILASPLETISTKDARKKIDALVEEYSPVVIYVGKPLHLSGGSSESTEAAEEFARSLERYGVPIEMVDERLTTKSASAQLSQAGYSAKESKSKIDSASAVAILEQALAREKR